jgi:hypothetical protein
MAISLDNLGGVARRLGEYGRAAALHAEGLALARAIGARVNVALGLEGLAAVAADRANPARDPRRAALLLAAAAALRAGIGVPPPSAEQEALERARQEALAALGDEDFAVAWAAGRALPLDEAVALALAGHDEVPADE